MYLFAHRKSSSFVILRRSLSSGMTFRNVSMAELIKFTRRRSLSLARSRLTFSVVASSVRLVKSKLCSNLGLEVSLMSS